MEPFLEVKLHSVPNVGLQDFAWNPSLEFAPMFICCMSDGSLTLWSVKDTELLCIASRGADVQANACKFSSICLIAITVLFERKRYKSVILAFVS